MNTATTTPTSFDLHEGFFSRRNSLDWLFAAIVVAGGLYAFSRYAAYMDGYEKGILLAAMPAAIWIGWFWRPLRVLMLVAAAFALLGIASYQGSLARAESVFWLQGFLSSQSAILWMSVLVFMSTTFYLIGMAARGEGAAMSLIGSRLAWAAVTMALIGTLGRWYESYLLGADVGHIPVSNLYEVFVLSCWLTTTFYLYFEDQYRTRALGAFAGGAGRRHVQVDRGRLRLFHDRHHAGCTLGRGSLGWLLEIGPEGNLGADRLAQLRRPAAHAADEGPAGHRVGLVRRGRTGGHQLRVPGREHVSIVSLLLGMGMGAATGAQPSTFPIRSLTPDAALKSARAALDACRKSGFQVAVAVVDRAGNTLVILRDQLAGPHTSETAANKAYTAITFKQDTLSLARATQPGEPSSGIRHLPRVVAVGGGQLIEAAGSLVGGIGISGAPGGAADDECAKAGINAIQDDLDL